LDYSSDDLVEITVTWKYQTFTCGFPAIGNEQPYEYFQDVGKTLVPSGEATCEDYKKAAYANGKGFTDEYPTCQDYLDSL